MAHRLGIDLGGTKIEGVVLDEAGGIVRRQRVPTSADQGYDAIIETTAQLVEELLPLAPGVAAIGIGTPGSVSRRSGRLRNSNTQSLNGRDLAGDLSARLGRPLVIENDANCFTLAEARLGAGRGHRVVFGVILGTGVGGGITIDGRVHSGPQHIAGEWGHHSIDPAGPDCYCGQRGCVETYLSGPALAARLAAAGGAHATALEVVAAARSGDELAAGVLAAYIDDFGRALANLIDVLDPDAVVLGGGLSNVDELYDRGRTAVARYIFNDELLTPVLRNQLGDSAGVIGAALLPP